MNVSLLYDPHELETLAIIIGRRLYVSGTGAEGADKHRDVDGVEEVRHVGISPSQPTTGSRERRKLPKWPVGIFGILGI